MPREAAPRDADKRSCSSPPSQSRLAPCPGPQRARLESEDWNWTLWPEEPVLTQAEGLPPRSPGLWGPCAPSLGDRLGPEVSSAHTQWAPGPGAQKPHGSRLGIARRLPPAASPGAAIPQTYHLSAASRHQDDMGQVRVESRPLRLRRALGSISAKAAPPPMGGSASLGLRPPAAI